MVNLGFRLAWRVECQWPDDLGPDGKPQWRVYRTLRRKGSAEGVAQKLERNFGRVRTRVRSVRRRR